VSDPPFDSTYLGQSCLAVAHHSPDHLQNALHLQDKTIGVHSHETTEMELIDNINRLLGDDLKLGDAQALAHG
jgi:hypothetical protein